MATFTRVNSSSSGAASRVSGSGDDASTTYTKASSPSSQSPSARSQQRTVLSDKYQIGEELGRGAYGVVSSTQPRDDGAVRAATNTIVHPSYLCRCSRELTLEQAKALPSSSCP